MNHQERMPIGMLIILILIGIGILGQLMIAIQTPILQFGPLMVTHLPAILITLALMAINIALFYGILKKKKWTFAWGIGWYTFSLLLSIVNYISFQSNPNLFDEAYKEVLTPEALALMSSDTIESGIRMGVFLGSITAIIVIAYFIKRKDYFSN